MDEYIKRETALTALSHFPLTWEYGQGVNDCYNAIKEVPAANVEPVRHGRWEYHLMPIACKCSACGYRTSNSALRYNHMNYCPNCGAKMDGGIE